MKFLKQLFCRHQWDGAEHPYLKILICPKCHYVVIHHKSPKEGWSYELNPTPYNEVVEKGMGGDDDRKSN